jgi:hypothetical protein
VAAARPDGGPSPKRQLVIGDFQPFTGNLRVERDCSQTVARDAFSPGRVDF